MYETAKNQLKQMQITFYDKLKLKQELNKIKNKIKEGQQNSYKFHLLYEKERQERKRAY